MPEFLKLIAPNEAMDLLYKNLPEVSIQHEILSTMESLGRIASEEIIAPHKLPEFSRASVDGYAVIARDTEGASESIPGFLSIIGEVPMGEIPLVEVSPGKCALIHTGGMLPKGADAVLMLEFTQYFGDKTKGFSEKSSESSGRIKSTDGLHEIEVLRPISKGENVIPAGDDIRAGDVVLEKGALIRPADIGSCLALGIIELRVAAKPRVGIISTGSEIIPPSSKPSLGQVRDINTYTMASLIKENGGEPVIYGIIPDDIESITKAANKAINECNMILISAGSSAGNRDRTSEIISSLGDPGILVHGINIRPGKPTIIAICKGKPIIGLPGNPVSAIVVARIFVTGLINYLLGKRYAQPPWAIKASFSVNMPSLAGRDDWIPVRLLENNERDSEIKYIAQPLFGKSNSICTFARADGLVHIPADNNGLNAGEIVDVTPL